MLHEISTLIFYCIVLEFIPTKGFLVSRMLAGACSLHAEYLRLQTHTHSGYVILTALSQQQWLQECASMSRYMYTVCLDM